MNRAYIQSGYHNIIVTMPLKSANSERSKIKTELLQILLKETDSWAGVVQRQLRSALNQFADLYGARVPL